MSTSKAVSDASANLSDRVSEVVGQTKSKLTDLGSAAAEKIDQNRGAAASGLEGAAGTLHKQADHLPGGEKVSHIAHSTADKLSATAEYVRENDLNSMRKDVEMVVKKNPGPALLVAAGLGFLVARALSRD